ncbi:MAG: transposase [Anaerolineae bacterium]
MSTEDFIIELFCRVDDAMPTIRKHSQASLYPSEIVTLGLLFALKGVGNRAFYRWLARDWRPWFPKLPERTRLFRLLKTHHAWTTFFLAQPTVLGVADSYGIELLHPIREGRSRHQIGKKGVSNKRWIVGGKLAFVLNQLGLIVAWDCATANVHDTTFQALIAPYDEVMIVLTDYGFHAQAGDPPNMKVCQRGEWNVRMVIETVLSMLTTVCHFKKVAHRIWDYFEARLAWTMAAFNVLVQWHGLTPDDDGFVHLSIAEFSL